MNYTLSDGREVDLSRVLNVSSLKDEGVNSQSISISKLAFHIRMKSQSSIVVERNYHFSDWAVAKIELERERNQLIQSWEAYKSSGK